MKRKYEKSAGKMGGQIWYWEAPIRFVAAAMGVWPARIGVREAANRRWVRRCSGGCVRAIFSRVLCSFLLREQHEVGFEIRLFLADTEFFSNVVPMKIDAVFRDAKKIGDFFARVAVPDKPSYPNFRG